jgi:hypothetical protein
MSQGFYQDPRVVSFLSRLRDLLEEKQSDDLEGDQFLDLSTNPLQNYTFHGTATEKLELTMFKKNFVDRLLQPDLVERELTIDILAFLRALLIAGKPKINPRNVYRLQPVNYNSIYENAENQNWTQEQIDNEVKERMRFRASSLNDIQDSLKYLYRKLRSGGSLRVLDRDDFEELFNVIDQHLFSFVSFMKRIDVQRQRHPAAVARNSAANRERGKRPHNHRGGARTMRLLKKYTSKMDQLLKELM